MAAELDVERFLKRLGKLHSHFVKHNSSVWNSADCLVLNRGPLNEDNPFLKSIVLHQWLFGYELPDTCMLIRKDGQVWFLATKKKVEFVQPAVKALSSNGQNSPIKKIHFLLRNKEDANAGNYDTMWEQAGITKINGKKRMVGTFIKERQENMQDGNTIVSGWEKKLDDALKQEDDACALELVDVSGGLAFCMSVKDDNELDLMKKSSVLSNKVMKHGMIKKMEEVIDSEEKITHEKLAQYVEDILDDPSKINLKVPKEDVSSCYFPIVQSGGKYDIRVSASSNDDELKHDVIIVSLGARYKNYCSNIARTFFVDPPSKVSDVYEILLELQDACIEAMKPGNQLKNVYKTVVKFLQKKHNGEYAHLVEKLPKALGFATGLDFRESNLLLTAKNNATFKQGMVYCLSLGFSNIELSEQDRSRTPEASPIKKLSSYSMLLTDMVCITSGPADILTKLDKGFNNVAYNINEEDSKGGSDDDEDEDDEDGDAALARKLSREQGTTTRGGVRQSSRLAKDAEAKSENAEGAAERELRQIRLMQRRNEMRLRELARANRDKDANGERDEAEELETYKRTRDYPDNVQPNQVRVDMANECVILPICGNPVPFHISTIKNVVMPDAVDSATLLRINFYTAGMAVGKDAPKNMVKLVQKYAPYASFIREMTFRSLDGHNLIQAFRQLSELRKRVRQKEIQEQEEADLVVQEKLVRTKNERVPRLADLTMRPVFAGRKTQGNLEAHTNGMRFISTRSEVVDIMYSNIKFAIFQPCENEIMVLVHFHLKNPIMIGKKKHEDIQFFTEVIDASQAVDNRGRSMYDPDEMDDESRERQLRKRLNLAFKDFCKKVDAVAKKNGYNLEFEIPYRDLGFTGNPHKEMVTIMPTLNCLVNLTETPFFVIILDQIDHVHFERVTYMSKAFDMVLINKDFEKQPFRIDMIPNGDKEAIQDWLTDMEITYTEGPMNLNWKQIMATVKDDDRFYMDTEEDEVTKKEAGWEFLRMFGNDDDDDNDPDEDDSEFDEDKEGSAESEEESEEEAFDSEEDDDDDFDGDEELEEQGMDWDEMEAEAAMADRQKRRLGGDELDEPPARKSKQRRTSQNSRPTNRAGGNRQRSMGGGRRR